MWFAKSVAVATLLCSFVFDFIICQDPSLDDFFLQASSKNVPRIGRSGSSKGSNDDFENFFLKASKSVPRIGRRDQIQQGRSLEGLPNSYIYGDKSEIGPNMRKHPNWSEIAKLMEYNPEIINGAVARMKEDNNFENYSNEKEYNRMKRTSYA